MELLKMKINRIHHRSKINSINNVTVINKVNIGSDHRMVGCTAKLNFRSVRSKLVLRKKIGSEKIKANKAAFQLELKNRFEALDISEKNINEVNNNITSAIRETEEII